MIALEKKATSGHALGKAVVDPPGVAIGYYEDIVGVCMCLLKDFEGVLLQQVDLLFLRKCMQVRCLPVGCVSCRRQAYPSARGRTWGTAYRRSQK